MNKKLVLETKIRDAASSLSKANAAYKNVTKQSSEQLDAANRKVDAAQKDLWRVSERANEVTRKLLEHRAGVLSHSVRHLEKTSNPSDEATTSGSSTPNRSSQMSPVTASSVTSIQTASSKGRFDGAHLFAGHADAVIPNSPRIPQAVVDAAAAAGLAEMEEKLQQLTAALEAATTKQTEMEQELSLVRMEKEEVETTLGMELQGAQDEVRQLEAERAQLEEVQTQMRALEEERDVWLGQRVELEERRQQVEELKRKVEALEAESGGRTAVEAALAAATAAHAVELGRKEQEIQEMRRVLESDRASRNMEKGQLDGHLEELTSVLQSHGVQFDPAQRSPSLLVASLGTHLDSLHSQLDGQSQAQDDWSGMKAQYESDLRATSDKHGALAAQLEQLRQERDDAKASVQELQIQLQVRFHVIYPDVY